MDKLKEFFLEIFGCDGLVKMVFGDLRKKSTPYKKISLRPIILQGCLTYQAEYHHENNVTHENLTKEQALDFCLNLIIMDFKQINVFTETENIQVLAANPGNPKITRTADTRLIKTLDHNKTKQYIIPDNTPCDFLIRLGVMDQTGKVLQRHYGKFRQINRFLEIVRDSEEYLPTEQTLKIIDFGCGKAYLTFALYHYLHVMSGYPVEIIGLDLKASVIEFCTKVAADLHYDGLTFIVGDIADHTADKADMVVTLHACDTATDYALINGVGWSTKVILSVPCCQHELFSQIKNDLHEPLYKHGILKDRFTEILTDGLRGLALEACGYDVSMIEFTSLEHTARNIMLKAVYTGKPSKKAAKEYGALKEYYQISPTIDKLI